MRRLFLKGVKCVHILLTHCHMGVSIFSLVDSTSFHKYPFINIIIINIIIHKYNYEYTHLWIIIIVFYFIRVIRTTAVHFIYIIPPFLNLRKQFIKFVFHFNLVKNYTFCIFSKCTLFSFIGNLFMKRNKSHVCIWKGLKWSYMGDILRIIV